MHTPKGGSRADSPILNAVREMRDADPGDLFEMSSGAAHSVADAFEDLLAACEALLGPDPMLPTCRPRTVQEAEQLREQARAAIRRARGEA